MWQIQGHKDKKQSGLILIFTKISIAQDIPWAVLFSSIMSHVFCFVFVDDRTEKQAGLSRATLEISSKFPPKSSVTIHTVVAEIFHFYILRSSIGGLLHLKNLYSIIWSFKLKFKI
jgi:hypothetical protein